MTKDQKAHIMLNEQNAKCNAWQHVMQKQFSTKL